MAKNLYYCVLKNYKGHLIRRHRGNTHLFLIPVSQFEYLYLGLVGLMVGEENKYATQLIVKIPSEIVISFINHEIKYFKGRYEVVDRVKCEPSKEEPGKYSIELLGNSYYFNSDLQLSYELEYSTPNRRIYTLEGDLNFMAGTVNKHSMSMVASKQQALLRLKRPGRLLSKKEMEERAAGMDSD